MKVTVPDHVRSELTKRWNEPHRRHHNQQHLDEVLAALDTLRDAGLRFDERPVVLAAWFHDAVYKPLSANNEQASADLARRLLDEDSDRDEVIRLVELTQTHEPSSGDVNGVAMSDADFAVLGANPRRYDEYAANVRREYRHVPEFLYRRKRRELLTEFLSRTHIFASAPAQQLWEESARTNIEREVRLLGGR